jgi:hypothetical protein
MKMMNSEPAPPALADAAAATPTRATANIPETHRGGLLQPHALGAIPGVRRVFTGRALRRDDRYQYCWLVRFANPAVVASYRDHPDHVAFANTQFRPIATDRISIDFKSAE